MTRDAASLQHRPFLTPIWLTIAGAFVGFVAFVILCVMGWVWITAGSTTIVVVRHAEKQVDAGSDPPLSPAGDARAAALMRMFGDPVAAHIDAIYVSPTLRSRMTAAPLAARLGLTPIVAAGDAGKSLARRVLREQSGGRVLIVAHTDTVTEIVRALSGRDDVKSMSDNDYGSIYIVSVPRIGRANLLHAAY